MVKKDTDWVIGSPPGPPELTGPGCRCGSETGLPQVRLVGRSPGSHPGPGGRAHAGSVVADVRYDPEETRVGEGFVSLIVTIRRLSPVTGRSEPHRCVYRV